MKAIDQGTKVYNF